MSLETKNQEFSYSDKETMLYGLGVGFGKDPLNDNELKFVYEKDLKTVPSMATVISWGAGNIRESGVNYLLVLHGEQRLKMYEPLPHAADILVDSSVKGVFDKGKEKGALIITETKIKLKENSKHLCTLSSTTFAREMVVLVVLLKELRYHMQFLIENLMKNLLLTLNQIKLYYIVYLVIGIRCTQTQKLQNQQVSMFLFYMDYVRMEQHAEQL